MRYLILSLLLVGSVFTQTRVEKITSVETSNSSTFVASAYCFSGRTAMGHGVRRGLIAADPRVIGLGSRVYINAGPWTGNYLVSDTGGAIKGKRIDIWTPSCAEARKFGKRKVQLVVLSSPRKEAI